MTTILIVAEKPSVARAITKALAIKYGLKFKKKKGKSKYNPVYMASVINTEEKKEGKDEKDIRHNEDPITIKIDFLDQFIVLEDNTDQVIVTSVIGHLYNFDYPPPFDKESDWNLTDPEELLTKHPVEIPINEEIVNQLFELGTVSNILSIATDFDGHGESIGWQIARTCLKVNQDLIISRMRFTATNPGAIIRAFENQTILDKGLIDQIDTLRRQDLKMGASVTRLLTVGVQKKISRKRLISYGPCQTAVLWLIASRYEQKFSFVPKKFWKYEVLLDLPLNKETIGENTDPELKWIFSWEGDEIFNEVEFNEHMRERFGTIDEIGIQGEVKEVVETIEKISRPLPLDTDTLESECSRLFQTSPKLIADTAEQLYNHGFITYPRTESSWYHEKDLSPIVQKFLGIKFYYDFARDVMENGAPDKPRQGRYTKDHEPIRPVKAASLEEVQSTIPGSSYQKYLATRIYDYVVRRFLATVHRDASVQRVKYVISVKDLIFSWEGRTIIDSGYLKFYPYKKIPEKDFPFLKKGEIVPVRVRKTQGWVYPPNLWSESELIREMANLGIGTDATRSTHINTVIEREYVRYSGSGRRLVPTTLGQHLYKALTKTAKELILPEIRSRIEKLTQEIREGKKTIEEVEENVTMITRNAIKNIKIHSEEVFSEIATGIKEMESDPTFLGYCRECKSLLSLRKTRQGSRWLQCENEECNRTYPIPQRGDLEILPDVCKICRGHVFLVGDGTKSWIFCPSCWIELKDGKNLYFCSKCEIDDCAYANIHEKSDFIPRGKFGKCPSCNEGDVLFQFRGTLTKVACTNSRCGAEWTKTPNIRRGTSIHLSDVCRLCGLKTIQVKRSKKAPYNMCIFCNRFCFECEFRCFE